MAKFLDLFPKIPYDINRNRYSYSTYDIITNITFRFGFLKDVIDDIYSYFVYTISDSDTPEILAEKIYGDPEAYWIILYANDIYDPQYDWPMKYDVFKNYIISKYGSVANASTSIHHYEKVVRRIEADSGLDTETRFQIDYDAKTNAVFTLSSSNGDFTVGNTVYVSADSTLANALITGTVAGWSGSDLQITISDLVMPGNTKLIFQTILESDSSVSGVVSEYSYPKVPYEYYLGLPEEASYEEIYSSTGKHVATEIISRYAVSNYEYEEQLNESKRAIKIIKPEYYGQIFNEFNILTNHSLNPTYRRFTTNG